MNAFYLTDSKKNYCSVIVSSPHSGEEIPIEIAEKMESEKVALKDDTDWHIPKLYDFIHGLNIPLIEARYHRWVVDLNRPPGGQNLYNDGRVLTSVVPQTDFLGNPIYKQHNLPTADEIAERLETYWHPYHQMLMAKMQQVKEKYGFALLWDAHSIRRYVPTISPEEFPDFIIGTNGGKSCSKRVEQIVQSHLTSAGFYVEVNTLFRGGHITRNYGKPEQGFHAIQLEMSKDLYLENDERTFSPDRAIKISEVLKNIFIELNQLQNL